jgi:hypothetical protein
VVRKILVVFSAIILSVSPISVKALEQTKKPWVGKLADLCQPVENQNDYYALDDLSKKKREEAIVKKNAEPIGTCLILKVSSDNEITYITFEENGDPRYSTKLEINFYNYANPPKPSKVTKKAKRTIVTGTIK